MLCTLNIPGVTFAIYNSPIVRNGKKATVGYCPDVWGAWE